MALIETQLIAAMDAALPDVAVYHDFAPDNAVAPFVVLQRVGGGGNLFLDSSTAGGYEARVQVSLWAQSRPESLRLSAVLEQALSALPSVAPVGAALAAFDADSGLRGMQQDFYVYY